MYLLHMWDLALEGHWSSMKAKCFVVPTLAFMHKMIFLPNYQSVLGYQIMLMHYIHCNTFITAVWFIVSPISQRNEHLLASTKHTRTHPLLLLYCKYS